MLSKSSLALSTLALAATFMACSSEKPKSSINDSETPLTREEYSFHRAEGHFENVEKSFEGSDGLSAKVVLENTDFGTPRRIERTLLNSDLQSTATEEVLRPLAESAAKRLFPQMDLRFLNLRKGDRFTYVTFEQTFSGRDVLTSKLVLRLNSSGDWVTASSTLVEPALLSSIHFDASESIDSARYFQRPHVVLNQREVIYPRRNDEGEMQFHAAKELNLYTLDKPSEVSLWIALKDGEVLGAQNNAEGFDEFEVVGSILPNGVGDDPIEATFEGVTLARADGTKFQSGMSGKFSNEVLKGSSKLKITLENPYLAILNNNQADSSLKLDLAQLTTQKLNLDEGPSLENRNAYYWLMHTRKYLENVLKYNGMDYQLVVTVNYGEQFDNAFFMPLTKTLSFGAGGRFFKNTALSRDIVIHEFGHAVTQSIYGTVPGYEFSAMNEAMSDYLAASVTNEPRMAEGMMLPAANMEYLRTVDNKMVYPKNYRGDRFHEDGQMFSGSLWDIRKALGAEKTDLLVHEARLAQARSIREFLLELLAIEEDRADKNPLTLNDTQRMIIKGFLNHGLNSRVSFVEKKENLRLPWKANLGCLSLND